jgi:hypothetical protein
MRAPRAEGPTVAPKAASVVVYEATVSRTLV